MLRSLVKALLTPKVVGPCIPQPAPFVDLSGSMTVAAAGATQLLRATSGRIEIYDLIVQTQGNNTFQILAGVQQITPVLTFTPDQPASFSGITLKWPDVLTIVCGNNSPVAVSFRYRVWK